MRASIYVQVILGIASLLPWTNELAQALFLSSFPLFIAINISLWLTIQSFNSYLALVVIGINVLLAAPMSLSLTILSIKAPKVRTGYTVFYYSFVIAKIVSLGICISIALSYNGESIASFSTECRRYYITMISIITISAFQMITSFIIPLLFPRKQDLGDPDLENGDRRKNSLPISPGAKGCIAFSYIFAILAVASIESLDKSAHVTWPDGVDGWYKWGFAQYVAFILSLGGPLVVLLIYLFQGSEDLAGRSPIVYVIKLTNFNLRTQPFNLFFFNTNFAFSDMWMFLSRVNLWPFFCWLAAFVLLGPSYLASVIVYCVISGIWLCILVVLFYKKFWKKLDNDLWQYVCWFVLWGLIFGIAIFAPFSFYAREILGPFWTWLIGYLVTMKYFKCWRGKNIVFREKNRQFWDLPFPEPNLVLFCSDAPTMKKHKEALLTLCRNQVFRPSRATIPREIPGGEVESRVTKVKRFFSCTFSPFVFAYLR